jgi:hypothetical protein
MPLHDWTIMSGWDGVHHSWITELLRWIKPRLPVGYRVYIGTVPTVAVAAPPDRPDVQVRRENEGDQRLPVSTEEAGVALSEEPDYEIALEKVDPFKALYVERSGLMIAALELISPRNKDRPSARETYLMRYLSYIMQGVHLLLVDVHRRPLNFSFADRIAQELEIPNQPSLPPPVAVSYRVGEPAATGGSLVALWRRPLLVGQPLPSLVLPISVNAAVTVDLEYTYVRAAADAYLT